MRIMTAITALLTFVAGAAGAQAPAGSHASSQPELKWGPAPAVFPAGAQMAVLQGDPSGTGQFTIRLRLPSGYKFPPHTHPTDENVTVIRGIFRVGMGNKFDEKNMMTLRAGGFVTAPAQGAHFAEAQGPTIVQVHALGPFALTYVNPADTPHAASSK
jgi:quercetin dioxygenase-like cupin family protein